MDELIRAQPLELAKEAVARIVEGDPLVKQDGNGVARAVETLKLLKAGFSRDPEVWNAITAIVSAPITEKSHAVKSWLLAIACGQQKANQTQLNALIAYTKAEGLLVERSESVSTTIKIEVTAEEAKSRLLSLAKDVAALNADRSQSAITGEA